MLHTMPHTWLRMESTSGTRDSSVYVYFAGAYDLLILENHPIKATSVSRRIMLAYCFGIATFPIGLYRPHESCYHVVILIES